MKAEIRVRLLSEGGEKCFGEGPYRLLRGVERLGSLRAAAMELGMAYSKASRILGRAERLLGAALTERRVGGPDGGGSVLTPAARDLIARYEAFRADCEAAAEESFARRFGDFLRPRLGCAGPENSQSNEVAAPLGASTSAARRGGSAPLLGCAVLAAGRSSRFGANKLLAELNGHPVLAHTLDALPGECFSKIVAVTSDAAVTALCREKGAAVREYPGGPLSDSIREALAAMDGTDGCMFVNGDQPLLRPDSLRCMAEAFAENPARAYRLGYGGEAASPAIIPAAAYPALRALTGESGGMAALRGGDWEIRTVEAEAESELWDVDDEEALRRAKESLRDRK